MWPCQPRGREQWLALPSGDRLSSGLVPEAGDSRCSSASRARCCPGLAPPGRALELGARGWPATQPVRGGAGLWWPAVSPGPPRGLLEAQGVARLRVF